MMIPQVYVNDGSYRCHCCDAYHCGHGIVRIDTIPKLPDFFMYWLLKRVEKEFLNTTKKADDIKLFCQIEIERAMIEDRLWWHPATHEWIYWTPIK